MWARRVPCSASGPQAAATAGCVQSHPGRAARWDRRTLGTGLKPVKSDVCVLHRINQFRNSPRTGCSPVDTLNCAVSESFWEGCSITTAALVLYVTDASNLFVVAPLVARQKTVVRIS
jgi:hypothetical protein